MSQPHRIHAASARAFRAAAATTALLAVALLGGCAQQTGHVATVDLSRIAANWPKFINFNNQLNSDAAAIEQSRDPERVKQQEREKLRQQFNGMQNEVAGDIAEAVRGIAAQRGFQLVVTREFVGYGGVDITPDVEKALNITEATPAK